MLCGLIGRHLSHSRSPQIHAQFGLPEYTLYELEPQELAGFLGGEQSLFCNVTIPYKRDVMPLCDSLSDEASEVGSVNTLIRRDGVLTGYNTDVYGFEYMVRRSKIDVAGKKALVFGSGGASLAVLYALRQLGIGQAVVISRSGKNNYTNLDRHSDAQVLVNTTPLGMYPDTDASPVDVSLFPHCQVAFDLIYNPIRTAFLLSAKAAGVPGFDGLPMLVAQAKRAQELYRGISIPDSETERVLRELRCAEQNIVLIGMPGCGKTTVGQLLSEMTGRQVLDTDALIVEREQRSIPDIFADGGEPLFRSIERDVIAGLSAVRGSIIVTGGGAVKDGHNRMILAQCGRVYHLTRDISALARDGRPLSRNADLDAMYRERLPLYTLLGDVSADNNGDATDCARLIWSDFFENTGN